MTFFGSDGFIGAVSISAPAAAGFAEPEWRGDRDYVRDATPRELDHLIGALDATIAAATRSGELDLYHARRAAFDLQSIRSQVAQARDQASGAIAQDLRRAILSRTDRLRTCLGAAATSPAVSSN
jgi:hypothetical protein